MEHAELLPTDDILQVDVVSSSPNREYISIGYANQSVEIVTRVEGVWTILGNTEANHLVANGRTLAILWHPYDPRKILVGYSGGTVQHMSFEEYNLADWIHVKRVIDVKNHFFNGQCGDIEYISLNRDASELSAVIDNGVFTFATPFSQYDFQTATYNKVIPDRFANDKPVGMWYISRTVLFVVYPLGIFTASTASRTTVLSTVNILPSKKINFARLSPDQSLCLLVTSQGQAEIYSTQAHTFIGCIAPLHGPFHTLESAAFYDYRAIILSYARQSRLAVLPRVTRNNETDNAQVFLYIEEPDAGIPFRILGTHYEDGRGKVIIQDYHHPHGRHDVSLLDPQIIIRGAVPVDEDPAEPFPPVPEAFGYID